MKALKKYEKNYYREIYFLLFFVIQRLTLIGNVCGIRTLYKLLIN